MRSSGFEARVADGVSLPLTSSVLEVDRRSPFDGFRTVEEPLARPGEGGLLLAVERFTLAANNISYVLAADALRSWDAFPSPFPGYGRIPVWGFATVIAADPSVAAVGTRLSGYLPMATHVAVHASRSPSGVLATDEPRAAMLPLYRRLTAAANESRSDVADVETALLPVIPFAALLADDLEGASAVVVTSASSRSALALSRLLSRDGVPVTGLTSARHLADIEALAVYDQILEYGEIDRIPRSAGVVIVDIAGASEVTMAVQNRLGDRLARSIAVGGTHLRSASSLPEPPVSMFNTGAREVEVARERGWPAVDAMYQRAGAELAAWAAGWLRPSVAAGLSATEPLWRNIIAGQTDPLSSVIIRP